MVNMDKTFSVKPNSFESLSTWSRVIVLWCCVTSVTASARVDSCYDFGADEEEIEDCDPSIHKVGETLTLHCGEFPPDPLTELSSVAWYKDGNLLSNGSLNLTIENISTASSGDYSCLLNSRSTPSQLVQVKDTSKWKFSAPDCWTRVRGIYNCTWHELTNDAEDTVTYDALEDDIQTRYQWHFTYDDETNTEVYPIVPNDGSYSVITVNSSSMRYYVTVCAVNCLGHFKSQPAFASEYHNAVPYPPGNVQLSPVSTDQMHVSFDHPVSWNYRHMLYRLKIVTQGDTWNEEKIMVSGDASFTFKVEPGKPYTQVCVKVAAYLELDSYSDDTSPVCHHTNMTAPSSGPPSFNFSSELHDGISNVTFSWQPLEPDTANGIITNYILIISWNESSCSILDPEHSIPADETEYSVNGLSSYCEYTAELFAENKMGISPPSVITVVGVPYPVNFQTPLRGALIFISFIGLCFVAVRSYLYMKKKLCPDVPEPSHKQRVWNYNMTDPVRHIEEEIFDELPGGLQRGISINTQSSEESECHYQVPSPTRALLGSNTTKPSSTVVKKDNYVAMRHSTDPQTAERQSSTSSANQFPRSYMTMSPSNSRSQLRGEISKNWKEPAVLYVDLQRSGALRGREAINRDTYGPFEDSSLQDGSEIDSLLQQVEDAGRHDDQPIESHEVAMTSTGDHRSLGQCADGSYLSLSNLQNGKDILLDSYLGEWDACSRVTDFKRMTGGNDLTPVKEDNFDCYVAEDSLMPGNQMEKFDEKAKNNSCIQEKSVLEVNGYVPNKQLDTCVGECDAYTREADLKRKMGDDHLTPVKENNFDGYVTEDSLRLSINQMEKFDEKAKNNPCIQEKSVLEVNGYVPNKQLDTCVGECDAYAKEADLKRKMGDDHLTPVKEDNFDGYVTEDSLRLGINQMETVDEKTKNNPCIQEKSVSEVNGYVPNKQLDTCVGECDAYAKEADLKRKMGDDHLTPVKEDNFDGYVTEDSLRLGINQMETVDEKTKNNPCIQEKSVSEVNGYVPNKQLDTCVGECDAYAKEADLKRKMGDDHLTPVKEDNFDGYVTEDSLRLGINQMETVDEKTKNNPCIQEKSVSEVNGYVPNKQLDTCVGECDAYTKEADLKRKMGDDHLTPVKEDNFDGYVTEDSLRLGINQMETVDEKTKNNPCIQEKSVSEVNGYVPNKQLDICVGECDAYTREADLKRKMGDNHLTPVKGDNFDCYVTEDSLRLGINQMETVDEKTKNNPCIQEKSVSEVNGYVPNKQLDTCVGECDAYTKEADLKRKMGDNHLTPVKGDNFDGYVTEDSLRLGINQMEKFDEKAKNNFCIQEKSVSEVNGYVPNKQLDICVGECDAYTREADLKRKMGDNHLTPVKGDNFDCYVTEDSLRLGINQMEKFDNNNSHVQEESVLEVNGYVPNKVRQGGYIKVSRCDDPYLVEEFAANCSVVHASSFSDASSVQSSEPLYTTRCN